MQTIVSVIHNTLPEQGADIMKITFASSVVVLVLAVFGLWRECCLIAETSRQEHQVHVSTSTWLERFVTETKDKVYCSVSCVYCQW